MLSTRRNPAFKRKIVITGLNGAGKSALFNRYLYDSFSDSDGTTIGIKHEKKSVEHPEKRYLLEIFDTPRNALMSRLVKQSYKDASVIIIVFDLASPDYLKGIEQISNEVNEEIKSLNPKPPIILVGMKEDLLVEERIKRSRLQQVTNSQTELKYDEFFAVSASENKNVSLVFNRAMEIGLEYKSIKTPIENPTLVQTKSSKLAMFVRKHYKKLLLGGFLGALFITTAVLSAGTVPAAIGAGMVAAAVALKIISVAVASTAVASGVGLGVGLGLAYFVSMSLGVLGGAVGGLLSDRFGKNKVIQGPPASVNSSQSISPSPPPATPERQPTDSRPSSRPASEDGDEEASRNEGAESPVYGQIPGQQSLSPNNPFGISAVLGQAEGKPANVSSDNAAPSSPPPPPSPPPSPSSRSTSPPPLPPQTSSRTASAVLPLHQAGLFPPPLPAPPTSPPPHSSPKGERRRKRSEKQVINSALRMHSKGSSRTPSRSASEVGGSSQVNEELSSHRIPHSSTLESGQRRILWVADTRRTARSTSPHVDDNQQRAGSGVQPSKP